eukprot:TRINITY_DN13120_c0_g1_i1.p1 TRINITY_DN13120_c0_g1~~TRINITY_DN13120_c0_g1_i1.p1  ORF type:complete len:150 (-),score=10.48 TRINITY_DN13120_c0_g1_i1:117-530(-)
MFSHRAHVQLFVVSLCWCGTLAMRYPRQRFHNMSLGYNLNELFRNDTFGLRHIYLDHYTIGSVDSLRGHAGRFDYHAALSSSYTTIVLIAFVTLVASAWLWLFAVPDNAKKRIHRTNDALIKLSRKKSTDNGSHLAS